MTVTPKNADAAPGFAIPDDDAADEDVDVLYLTGQRPPAAGADVGAYCRPSGQVEMESAAGAAATGFPALSASARPAADG